MSSHTLTWLLSKCSIRENKLEETGVNNIRMIVFRDGTSIKVPRD